MKRGGRHEKETFILQIFAGLLLFVSNEAFSGSPKTEEVAVSGGGVTEKKAIKSAPQKAIQKEAGISVGGGTLCTDIPRFALCTSAPCQFDKNDPNSLVCDCVVVTGSNWEKNTCQERMPRGTERCSNFSPIQAGAPLNLKALVCDNEQMGASCLDAPCTVDPNDPTKAKCKESVLECKVCKDCKGTVRGTVRGTSLNSKIT